jgi:hypothetical protein
LEAVGYKAPVAAVVITVALMTGGCAAPEVVVVTASLEATARTSTATPTRVPTETATVTNTPSPTKTPTVTNTPLPTNTPIAPAEMTQTAVAVLRQATRESLQWIDDVHQGCLPIDWVELSEVEYAKDHEDECVYIRGRVSDLNFEESLFSIFIGYYSANIPIGVDGLKRDGRIVEDDWVEVYGHVCTDCWITTNRLDGKESGIAGVQAILIETSNGTVWQDTRHPFVPPAEAQVGRIVQHADGTLYELQADGRWIEVPMYVRPGSDGACPAGFHNVSLTRDDGKNCERDGY